MLLWIRVLSAIMQFSVVVLTFMSLTTGIRLTAQSNQRSSKVVAVKRKADSLRPKDQITVVRNGAQEQFGEFISDDADNLTFFDVDAKSQVTLNFREVRKIESGYGGSNSVVRRHTDRTKSLVIVGIVLGGLAILVTAAALSN